MKAVSVSSLRAKLKDYFDEVIESSEIIVVPRNKSKDEAVVIMSIQEYNSILETEYLLRSKANRERLQQSLEQMDRGEFIDYALDD